MSIFYVLWQREQGRSKKLAEKGQEIEKPEDILKDPYVFEFVGLPENKPVMEADFEDALINHIEKFLLELGKGFMFVGRQQRITFDNGTIMLTWFLQQEPQSICDKGILRSLMKSFWVCNSVFAMKSMKLSSFPFPRR